MGVRRASALSFRWNREWGCASIATLHLELPPEKETWQEQPRAVSEAQLLSAALGRVSGSPLSLLSDLHLFIPALVWCAQQDIFKQATEDRLTSAKELPYFEGDFWPNVLEESIKELEQEEEERKKEESTAASETTEVGQLYVPCFPLAHKADS